MKEIVRHFLPSVIRGVYRFDDAFSEIEDEEAFARFIESKLLFLPRNVPDEVRQAANLDENYTVARRRLALPGELLDTDSEVARRARAFFRLHPYFAEALSGENTIENSDKFLEIQFVKRVLAPLLNDAGLHVVSPQMKVGPYRVDFALEGETKLALEVDGFSKFTKRNDLDEFVRRQNYITSQGWRVIRFTYGQVMKMTGVTVRDLHNILQVDRKLRRFLTIPIQSYIGFLPGLELTETKSSAIDLVNNFYRIQDCFVDLVMTEMSLENIIALKDDFGFKFPFVAAAISALYEFLDAVAGVVDVDFGLPQAHICGPYVAPDWSSILHPLVSLSQDDVVSAHIFNAQVVKERTASVPTPACNVDEIAFRQNMPLDDIHQKLEYFTRNVFGYPKGTNQFQNRVLQRVFNGQDVLGISATGSGKSFCFWMPALLRPGLTLVITPLRSLMRDQKLTLRNYGIASAEFINADVDQLMQRRILEEAKLGYVRLLYISPERLRIKRFLADLDRLQEFVPVNFLAIDEAHCISEWGHDFRPSYLKLPFLREALAERNRSLRLIALTATAGQQVEQDMLGILKLRGGEDGDVVRDRVADRPRFSYQIVTVEDGSNKTAIYKKVLTEQLPKALNQSALQELLRLLNQRQEKTMGIVFCIYADPHGKHSKRDGVTHYLFETMHILEPNECFEPRHNNLKRFRIEAFSKGKVRAFSSKPPTLCPRCHSYEYTSSTHGSGDGDDGEKVIDNENQTGVKICYSCNGRFDDAKTVTNWEDLIEANQNDFKDSRFDILVATKGFGMGIDKSSVRFIVHTSLPSGLESWYQEIGRAGRDDERAHIVLLADPPNEACRRELGGLEIKRPGCSYRRGCPHGKETLCDYGKQHMFITNNYPGVETDAIRALRMLDKLIETWRASAEGIVVINSRDAYLAQDELSIYRLTVLGIVEDYKVIYRKSLRNPHFEVSFTAPESTDRSGLLSRLEEKMQRHLTKHFSHFTSRRDRTIVQGLNRVQQEYRPLSEFSDRLRRFRVYSQYTELFRSVYSHLLLLLDHTYKDVLKMRYDMLWNLLTVATTQKCRRTLFLPHFGDSLEESYRCGSCDICAPNLDFPEIRNTPKRASNAEKELQLEKILSTDSFHLPTLQQLVEEFKDYPTAKYRQARSILEGSPNNLPALFLAREFSPSEEFEGNARRLLRTTNQRSLPLAEIQNLYRTSPRQFRSNLLLLLNETDTACDNVKGWKFLAKESGKPEHARNEQVGMMRECLEFFLVVEEALQDNTQSLKQKAHELERAFYA